MIYFGENNEYILCECEVCKGEMYIERNTVSDEDAYAYHLYTPIKCRCGAVDEYINRAKKSCHKIKHELFSLSDLLHKQQNVSNKIGEITAELNKKFEPPSFWQSIIKDILFALKVFLILLGAVIGVEIFLFIITALMFFFGFAFNAPGIAANGNELFYNINIFKDRGGHFLSKFGWNAAVKPLNKYGVDIREGLVFGYIPAAIAGIIIIVFYVFLAVLIVRVSINVAKLTFFASKVMNQKIKINQKREEYQKQLDDLSVIYQNLCDQINECTIIPNDYKSIRATDSILRYFINNRIDTIKEAVNLYHEEDFRNRMLEYSKASYSEVRQTRRYTKALYMMTSDENIKVDIRETKEDMPASENDNAQVGEMLKGAFTKIKKPSSNLKNSKKISRISPPAVSLNSSSKNKKTENIQNISDNSSNLDQEYSETSENTPEVNEPAAERNEIKEVREPNVFDELSELLEIQKFQELTPSVNLEDIEDAEISELSESTSENDMSAVLDSVTTGD